MDPYDAAGAELNLQLDGLVPLRSSPSAHLAQESTDAVATLNALPESSQKEIRKLMFSDESLQFVEKPSRWRSNVILIAVSLLGTFAFIMLLIFRGSVNANVIVITAVFPLSLVAAAYSIYRGEQRYFVLTNKRLLSKPGWSSTVVIDYDRLVAVSIRFNFLMLMHELEIKHEIVMEVSGKRGALASPLKKTKVDYVDSVSHLETYLRFLEAHTVPSDNESQDL